MPYAVYVYVCVCAYERPHPLLLAPQDRLPLRLPQRPWAAQGVRNDALLIVLWFIRQG